MTLSDNGGMRSDALVAELSSCERAVWDALVAGDKAADGAALDPEFLGVYPDGFSGRAEHMAPLASGPTVERYTLSELRARPLGAEHALLVYRARYRRTGSRASEEMLVSSIWRRKAGGGWINVFSQDTPATGAKLP